MAIQYQTIKTPSLALGLDQEATENRIADGYVELLQNADPKPTGQIEKRRGYQGYAGNLPVRVAQLRQTSTPNKLCFLLPPGVDLSNVSSSPIVVLGRQKSNVDGDFPASTTNTIRYYSEFEVDIRRTFTLGTHSDSYLQTDHNLSGPLIWGGTAESTSTFNSSNTQFLLDSFKIDQGTQDITYEYSNFTTSDFDGFVFLADRPDSPGTVYNSVATSVSPGTQTITIPVGTHGLNNNNILVKVFRDNTTIPSPESKYEEIVPSNVTISNVGTVSVEIVNDTGSSYDVIVSLVSVPTGQFLTGATSGTSAIVDIDITGQSPFLFIACYQQVGTDVVQVLPDSIVTDTTTNLCTVTFTTSSPANFKVFWDYGRIVANRLCVTPQNAATDITDAEPQLTIWGLDHSEIYGSMRTAPQGWVNHIDSYNSSGENRLVAGLGGNIFSVQKQTEGNNETDYMLPTLYPNVQNILNADITIGPAFIDSSDTSSRTRGYIKGDNGASNNFTVDSVEYDSGSGWTKYTLSIPNMVISGTLSTIISTTSGMEDRLTTEQCGWANFDGEFKIMQVTQITDGLEIYVDNPNVTTTDFNETDVGGFAGIFTDRITFTGSTIPRFLPDDILLSGLFTVDVDNYEVINSKLLSGTPTTLFRNVISEKTLPVTLKVTGKRTSAIIPLRNLNATQAMVDEMVRGDILSYSEINRLLRIVNIIPLADTTLTFTPITGNDTEIVITGISTAGLQIGQKIAILGASYYTGVQVISDITSATEFNITSTITPIADSGTLLGYTIEVDENLTYQDTETSSYGFSVVSRFIPVEIPTDTFDLTPKTRVQHFRGEDYSNQSIIRSTMVQDNMYFANGQDEILKFDGSNIYRAGLFRWQPNLFINIDTSATGKITVHNPVVTTTAASVSNIFKASIDDLITFKVGDVILHSLDGEYYTIVDIAEHTTPSSTYISVDRNITTLTSGGTLTRTSNYKYYFRLNAVDVNNNLLASAVTGSDDSVVRLASNAAVKIRLIGMPAWDIYDYDRLEVQVYRTKANSVAPYYRITTLPMSFNEHSGYLDFVDSTIDEALFDLDEINTALKGAELGTAWAEPLRAKYVTSADNRLILGNLTGYPELSINVVQNNTVLTQSVFTNSSNRSWLFRRDNTDTGTTPDMLNRAGYQFIAVSGATAVTGATTINGTEFTLNIVNSSIAGDWIYLFHDSTHSTNVNLRFSGWFQIASRTGTTITINNDNTDTSSFAGGSDVNKCLFAVTSGYIPVPIGTDYNYGMLNGNKLDTTAGYQFIAMKRMADAINVSMRKTDITITGYEEFAPWLIAAAGNEIGSGKLTVRQPKSTTLDIEVKVPALSGDFDVYVNDVRRAGGAEAGALTKTYPSRIIISYPNYPEIFDAPEATIDVDSDSAIDVNSADGQDITAIIPFFGDSAFGAALKSGVVVVFKTNSIYLIDVSAKARGLPAVQKIESMGKGCTAPYSVSVTKAGIMFANETGIYKLTRDMQVVFVGRKYGRLWTEGLNRGAIDIATGTHDTDANAYKLSYPTNDETENSLVAVYNHTTEEVSGGYGSWTQYTNHAATGWANLLADSYFGTTTGRVFSVRKLGEVSDYRDDSSAVEMAITPAAMDFGDSGRRKLIKYVTTHYRGLTDTSGTTLKASTDLNTAFQDTDIFRINRTTTTSGLSGTGERKVVTIQSSLPTKKGVYVQLKYENSTIDEPVVLAGIDYTVGGLSERGITQAAQT